MKITWIIAAAFLMAVSQSSVTAVVADTSSGLQLAQQVTNTLFSEATPDFNDMYMIRSEDKVRQIRVYCNPSSCYKLRNFQMHS